MLFMIQVPVQAQLTTQHMYPWAKISTLDTNHSSRMHWEKTWTLLAKSPVHLQSIANHSHNHLSFVDT